MTFDALLASLPLVLLLMAVLGQVVHTSGDPAMQDLLELLDRVLPRASNAGDGPIRRAERLLTGVVESRGQLSVFGLPLFLVLATRFFSGTRAALNEVFDTSETRSYLRGKMIDLYLVLVTLVLVVANAYLTLRFAQVPWLGRFAATVSTYAVGVLLFYVIYTVAPTRRMRPDTAVVAAAVAALGFELAKRTFSLYLSEAATIDRLISNANAIAVLLFVLWIYAMSCVFLVGAEVAETYDLLRRQREQREILA